MIAEMNSPVGKLPPLTAMPTLRPVVLATVTVWLLFTVVELSVKGMAGALVTISAETEPFLFVPLLATHLDVERAERGGVGPVRAGKRATALLCQLRLHVGDRPRQLTHDVVSEDLDFPRHRDLGA